jgi:hypothetical protein
MPYNGAQAYIPATTRTSIGQQYSASDKRANITGNFHGIEFGLWRYRNEKISSGFLSLVLYMNLYFAFGKR